MCNVFKVSSSGFYYWLKHPKGKRVIEKDVLVHQITKIYRDSKGRYVDFPFLVRFKSIKNTVISIRMFLTVDELSVAKA
jgi:hypothetical protein